MTYIWEEEEEEERGEEEGEQSTLWLLAGQGEHQELTMDATSEVHSGSKKLHDEETAEIPETAHQISTGFHFIF